MYIEALLYSRLNIVKLRLNLRLKEEYITTKQNYLRLILIVTKNAIL